MLWRRFETADSVIYVTNAKLQSSPASASFSWLNIRSNGKRCELSDEWKPATPTFASFDRLNVKEIGLEWSGRPVEELEGKMTPCKRQIDSLSEDSDLTFG